jgi:predicted O-methyltransferase YrrM
MGLIKKIKRFAATKPVRGFEDINGWLSDKEAMALYELASSLPDDAVVVEIGSWQGKSTYCLARGLRSGMIHAIDPFDSAGESGSDLLYVNRASMLDKSLLETFKNNLQRGGLLKKVSIHHGYSKDFVGNFESIDFLFIDGDHSVEGCLFDYEKFSPAIRIGGLLGFHDYQPKRHDLGPTMVIDTKVRPSGKWVHLVSADSLMVFRRNA